MSDRKRNATARGSLGYSANASVLFFFLGIGAVGVLVKALHVSMYGPQGALIAIGYIAVGVACLLAPSVVRRRVRRARLAKLEFPFDVDAYLDALNQRSVHGALEVEVELGDSAVPDATTLTMPTTSSVRSSAGKLVLVSPAMRTTRQSYPSGAYFYNGALDRWFARA